MAKRWVAASVLILFAASGCGTVMNLTESELPSYHLSSQSEPRTAYGGVAHDLDVAPWMAFGGNPVGVAACACYLTVDVPLSAVGDTLTLPYILYLKNHPEAAQAANQRAQDSQSPRSVILRHGDDAPAAIQGAAGEAKPPSAPQRLPYDRVEGGLE